MSRRTLVGNAQSAGLYVRLRVEDDRLLPIAGNVPAEVTTHSAQQSHPCQLKARSSFCTGLASSQTPIHAQEKKARLVALQQKRSRCIAKSPISSRRDHQGAATRQETQWGHGNSGSALVLVGVQNVGAPFEYRPATRATRPLRCGAIHPQISGVVLLCFGRCHRAPALRTGKKRRRSRFAPALRVQRSKLFKHHDVARQVASSRRLSRHPQRPAQLLAESAREVGHHAQLVGHRRRHLA